MKTIAHGLSLCFSILILSVLNGQDLPFLLDFETAGGYTPVVPEFSDGDTDYFIRTNGMNIGPTVNISNVQGSYFFGAQDTNGDGQPSSLDFRIDDIDIVGTSGHFLFSVFLAEDDDGSNQDWDQNSSVIFEYDIDDSGNWQPLIAVEAVYSTNANEAPAIDTDFDGIGDGTEITDEMVKFSATFSSFGSSIDLRISIKNLDDGDEDIAIDHIEIVDIASVCPISALTLESASCTTISEGAEDTYSIEVSYTGMSALANVTNLSGSGAVTNGDISAGSPIVIGGISESDDWIFSVIGDNCNISFEGIAPNCNPVSQTPNLRINELDSNTPSFPDLSEFIELKGDAGLPLDDFVLVLYNGSNDLSYHTIDFSGMSMPSDSFFVICFNNNTSGYCDLNVSVSSGLQNGVDGLGLYYEKGVSDFPNMTEVTSDGLIDGIVYDNGTDDNPRLVSILDTEGSGRVNENENGNGDNESIQRGSWFVAAPTPGIPNNAILPVRFLDFQVKKEGSIHTLSWKTTEEINHDYYEVEVSQNDSEFLRLGKVKKGELKGRYMYYRYQNFTALSGMYHYRIKQVDMDGRFAFSPLQSLLVNSNASDQFKVYPTQVEDALFIEKNNLLDVSTEILCFDISGKVVVQRRFSPGIQKMTLPVSQLPASTYILRIMSGDAQFVTRIIKMGE